MPNPTTLIDGEDRLNSEVARDFECDACYGPLVERYEPDPKEGARHWIIQCFDHPEHHGFINKTTAQLRQRKEEFRGRE